MAQLSIGLSGHPEAVCLRPLFSTVCPCQHAGVIRGRFQSRREDREGCPCLAVPGTNGNVSRVAPPHDLASFRDRSVAVIRSSSQGCEDDGHGDVARSVSKRGPSETISCKAERKAPWLTCVINAKCTKTLDPKSSTPKPTKKSE